VCARPGPDLERVAARSRVRRSVKGGGARRSSKGVVCSPQVGNILWVTPVAERACSVRVPVHRWKAPRARLTSLFFAEGRARRPSVGSACRRWGLHPARRPSHDERCPSGSDRGSRAPGARKGAMSRRTWSGTLWVPLAPARPLTRETSASAGQRCPCRTWRGDQAIGGACSRIEGLQKSASRARPPVARSRGGSARRWKASWRGVGSCL